MCTFWGFKDDSIEILDDISESKVKHLSLNVIESQYKKGADDLEPLEKASNGQLYDQNKMRC